MVHFVRRHMSFCRRQLRFVSDHAGRFTGLVDLAFVCLQIDVPLHFSSVRWDRIRLQPEKTVALLAEGVPSLRYLVWQPVWGEYEEDVLPGGEAYDLVRAYQDDIFGFLKLDVLAFALADGKYSCYDAGKEDARDGRPIAGSDDLWKSMKGDDQGVRLL